MEWDPRFSVGVEAIDRDHREMLGQLSALADALQAGLRSQALVTLDYVTAYVDRHFALEEREMSLTAYPLFHMHRAAHGRLRRQAQDLSAEYRTATLDAAGATRLLAALTDLFARHIVELDALLGQHLRDHAEGRTVRGPSRARPAPR